MTESINGGGSRPKNVSIASLSDDADIRAAFKIYHYGTDGDNDPVSSSSIAGYLTSIDSSLSSKVDLSTVTAKGDILVGTASGNVDNVALDLSNPSYEYVLARDTSTSTGVKWVMSGKDEERISNIMGVY